MQQTIGILISNALRYTLLQGSITVAARSDRANATIVVTGSGTAAQQAWDWLLPKASSKRTARPGRHMQNGEVRVDGTIETRRGRKLVDGDRVTFRGKTLTVDI